MTALVGRSAMDDATLERLLINQSFTPDRDLQRIPAVKEGYVINAGSVKWTPYKPGYTQTKRKGRWQACTEYGGWDNIETPAEIWTEFPDYRAALDEIARLRAALTSFTTQGGVDE